ncbi:unnamed protein product [Phyllotreta striolata]|uniref:Cadherin domain-containing protein n=1 Tax=Phyllotreta striolata TaxID=444603 RepID=A0A9N9TPQ1_PHYSR|nr:unnamed protein product [Phyllotreta striolata]
MDNTKIFFILVWINAFTNIHCGSDVITIKSPDATKIDITPISNRGWNLTMDENNHNFETRKELFIINDPRCNENTFQKFSTGFDVNSFMYELDSDCKFYSDESFDYENQNQRHFQFHLTYDGQPSSLTTIILNIRNIDDESPVLTCPKCSLEERKIYTEENSTCAYTLYDPDGFLEYMHFDITGLDAQNAGLFKIDPPDVDNFTYTKPVKLTNTEMLDYDATNLYSFSITVIDSGSNKVTQNAIVKVNDTRHTPPKWVSMTNFQEITEKTIQTIQVKAIDGDTGLNKTICYYKKNESDAEANYITVDKDKGIITINKIDRDKNDISEYYLYIEACVCDEPSWCQIQKMTFSIIDVDDHNAEILKDNYKNGTIIDITNPKIVQVSFLENAVGSFNFTSFIEDRDTGDNANFQVELTESGTFDYTVAYTMVPSSGYKKGNFAINIKNSTYLDFEDKQWYIHSFNVETVGTRNSSHIDKLFVNVSLIDYNDEIPKFDEANYAATINETAKTGDFVLIAHATDRDAEDKILHMEISGEYAKDRLQIVPDGTITVNLTNPNGDDFGFDYDELNSVFFQVKAIDRVGHTTVVPVTLTIADVNNKKPIIEPVEDSISVEENQVDGIFLNATITASDPDTTGNLTASIDWSHTRAVKNSLQLNLTDPANMTAIQFLEPVVTPRDGEVRNINIKLKVVHSEIDGKQTKPDFETFDSLYLKLVVTDLNTDPEFLSKQNSTVDVLITIIDINDNPPVFPADDTNRTVIENANKDVSVGSIQATDKDAGTILHYNCTADDPDADWIVIDELKGTFSVKETGKINADVPKRYTFSYTCGATDGLFYTETVKPVVFYIIDTNSRDPVITPNDTFSVKEKSRKGQLVSPIETSDLDRDPPFHALSCHIDPKSDNGDCSKQFEIQDDTKHLVVKNDKTLDRDKGKGVYKCTVICTDNPNYERSQSPRTSSSDFVITLIDINDHAPTLHTLNAETSENLKLGAEVCSIYGEDIDEGDNARIVFGIQSVKDATGRDFTSYFELKNTTEVNATWSTVHLFATKNLKSLYGNYIVQLKIHDKGTPQQTTPSDQSILKLQIDKYNYASPTIAYPDTETLDLLTDQTIGKPLMMFGKKNQQQLPDFIATDGQTKDCSKWNVTFGIEYLNPGDPDIFKLVKIKPCESQLQVTNQFNPETGANAKTYQVKFTAWLNSTASETIKGDAPWFASTTVKIMFISKNEEPYFKDDTPWVVTFDEKNTTQLAVLGPNRQASYDIGDFSLYYEFLGDAKIAQFFTVDKNSGDVHVKSEFLYDDHKRFDFKIVASNDSTSAYNTNPMGYLNVTVLVKSVNWRPPSFINEPFFGAIMPTYKAGVEAVSIKAMDPDEVDKNKLVFTIKDITRHGKGLDFINDPAFSISSSKDVGSVVTSFPVDSSMSGYFELTIVCSDQAINDGPHHITTKAAIFIITTDNTIRMEFLNSVEEIKKKQDEMLKIVSTVLKYNAFIQNVNETMESGGKEITTVTVYFIDVKKTALIPAKTIMSEVSDPSTYATLYQQLRNETLYLNSIPGLPSVDNSEEKTRKLLLGISIALGLLCIILLAVLVWKTRQLTRRISKLTKYKFSSQDSGLNRIGAPTTNMHALEGTNPIYKNDINQNNEMKDFDKHSIRSGDSDLIGVEDNPEFDLNFNSPNDTTTYL